MLLKEETIRNNLLELAQVLYEKHKLISYPRTDCRYLSNAIAATLGAVVEAIKAPYEDALASATGTRKLGKRFVDDSKIGDHHAIMSAKQRALVADAIFLRVAEDRSRGPRLAFVATVQRVLRIDAQHPAVARGDERPLVRKR